MSLQQRRWAAGSILLACALLGGLWLAGLDYRTRITTDVLDLVPDAKRSTSPELALVRSLASQAEIRTMFFVLTLADGTAAPRDTAASFAAALLRDPAFAQAFPMGDTTSRDALGQELHAQRFTLLFPFWLARHEAAFRSLGLPRDQFVAWLATESAAELSRFLASPQALAFQDLIPSDPLLLLPGAIDRLEDGQAFARPQALEHPATLVWAQLAASPLSEEGQRPAFAAIARATDELRKTLPGLTVASTGVNRFAAASREVIEHEVTLLNGLSLAAVLTVAFLFIRTPLRGLHLVPVVALSILGAWVAVTLSFERVHILVFVVGSLLTGVAIDYGFYLYMQPAVYPGEDYVAKVRRLLKPLLASCFTTVAGFALLLFSDLPFIRQLGVFVGGGLLCALGAAVLYFATVRTPFLESRSFLGGQALTSPVRLWLRRATVAVWIAALPGLAFLSWRDDIRDLDIPSLELKREDARIRSLFGDEEERTVYLTHGDTLAAARDSLGKLESWLTEAGGGRARPLSLAAVVPTEAEFRNTQTFIRDEPSFPSLLKAALAKEGFEDEGFTGFFSDYGRARHSASSATFAHALGRLRGKLAGPLGMLVNSTPETSWFVTLVRNAPSIPPPPETSSMSTGQLQSLNGVFKRYRESTLRLSLVGLGIVGLGVLLTYGVRDGLRIFAIPCGACLGLFGVFGWLGHPLNMFHLLGAFLGVCLTHNYSIFSATSAYEHQTIPVSVRVSALTTAASFGVLAISSIPVVRALGVTVASMVVTALLMIELEHLSGLGKRP
ncbi:MAG: MMPL family transporter [Opitutaceae bacterium]|nr:MMPL family transporter [Opitutaceae bacterium]